MTRATRISIVIAVSLGAVLAWLVLQRLPRTSPALADTFIGMATATCDLQNGFTGLCGPNTPPGTLCQKCQYSSGTRFVADLSGNGQGYIVVGTFDCGVVMTGACFNNVCVAVVPGQSQCTDLTLVDTQPVVDP